MTTVVYLVRHADHALIDRRLVGRSPHVGLSSHGIRQAHRLGQRLAREPIIRIQSSPQRRARETAEPIAEALALPVHITSAIDELDLGAWTGLSFDELEADQHWQHWNAARAATRPPEGESMYELQVRMLDHLEALQREDPDGDVVIVTHAEPIRAAVLHYRRLPIDDFATVCIDPASITTIVLHRYGGEVVDEQHALCGQVAT